MLKKKKTRTNLKKLGCLFESFLGALFLDFNKITINDEGEWFKNVFVTGPGFQIAQTFVENIFEKHVNWTDLIKVNDNYKNRLQVVLQKAFKVTPIYMEIGEWDEDEGYHMGVFLCIGQHHHGLTLQDAITMNDIGSCLEDIIIYMEDDHDKIWLFLGESKHKIKKKAEQAACKSAYEILTGV